MEKKKSYVLRGALWIVALHIVIGGVFLVIFHLGGCQGSSCNFFIILDPIFYAGSMIAWGIGGDNYTSSSSFVMASYLYGIIPAALVGALIGFLYKRHREKKHGEGN